MGQVGFKNHENLCNKYFTLIVLDNLGQLIFIYFLLLVELIQKVWIRKKKRPVSPPRRNDRSFIIKLNLPD